MPTYTIYTYRPDALTFSSGTFTLAPGYNYRTDRYRIEVTDDDTVMHGDAASNELGDDANQTATVYDSAGNVVASGRIYAEERAVIRNGGTDYVIDRLEIGGVHVGYTPSTPLTPGNSYSYVGGGQIDNSNDADHTYYSARSVPCFAAGTLLACPGGPRAVETLGPGALVMTRNHGVQPVIWAGVRHVTLAQQLVHPGLRPVTIARGALGGGRPGTDLVLSPQHRVVVGGGQVSLYHGQDAAFVAAGHLTHWPGIGQTPATNGISYHHILLPVHGIVLAHRTPCESLFAAADALLFSPDDRRAMARALASHDPVDCTALPCLSAHEAAMLISPMAMRPADARLCA